MSGHKVKENCSQLSTREGPWGKGSEAKQDPPGTPGAQIAASSPAQPSGSYSRKGPGLENWLKGYNLGSFL